MSIKAVKLWFIDAKLTCCWHDSFLMTSIEQSAKELRYSFFFYLKAYLLTSYHMRTMRFLHATNAFARMVSLLKIRLRLFLGLRENDSFSICSPLEFNILGTVAQRELCDIPNLCLCGQEKSPSQRSLSIGNSIWSFSLGIYPIALFYGVIYIFPHSARDH